MIKNKESISLPKQLSKDWEFHSILSFDSFHTICLLTHRREKRKSVLKIYKKQYFSEGKYHKVSKISDTYLMIPKKHIHTFREDYILYENEISLREMICSTGLSFRELLNLGIHLTLGIESMMQAKYYGADINPCNIYYRQDGIFILGDLNLEKGDTPGTAPYIPPELAVSHKINKKLYAYSMQYSICKLLKSLCDLQKEFFIDDLKELLETGLQENPHQRFASLEELRKRLSALLDKSSQFPNQLLVLHQKDHPLFLAKTCPLVKKTYQIASVVIMLFLGVSILLFFNSFYRYTTVFSMQKKTAFSKATEVTFVSASPIPTKSPVFTVSPLPSSSAQSRETIENKELDVQKKGLYSFSTVTKTTKNPESFSCIYGGGNYFSDINTISSFSRIKELYLDDNQIRDITEIKDCSQIEILVLSYNYIEDISPLTQLTNLSHLDISSNRTLQEISALKEMTSLRTLNISDTNISQKQYRQLCKKLPHCQIIY